MNALTWTLGFKTDPIETRYSFPWLFRILADEGVRHVQLGTFFELYHLPDAFLDQLRGQADEAGVRIASVFTAHRELGGWFRPEPGFADVARDHLRRLIRAGARLGAESVGLNPGAVVRDRPGDLAEGCRIFAREFADALRFARDAGVPTLTLEPMSTWAEPPTLPDEVRAMGEAFAAVHAADPGGTAAFGYCVDVAHGYVDADGRVVHDHFALMEAALPWLHELHLKNTDARYRSTFGFGPGTEHGIVDLAEVRRFLDARLAGRPTPVAYLEIGGPKLGRDDTDPRLEAEIRASLRAIRDAESQTPGPIAAPAGAVEVWPSLMCVDPLRVGEAVARLERLGVAGLHLDVMDGRFVPNLPLGLEAVRALPAATALPLDVHLMVEDPDAFLNWVLPLRPARVAVHLEALRHADRTLARIRDAGSAAAVALNPGTPLGALDALWERVDALLLMTVNPGFAGQALVPGALRKVAEARARFAGPIVVDGNVSFANIPGMVAAGADGLVAGTSSLFAGPDWAANRRAVDRAAAEGLARRTDAAGGRR